MPVYPQICDRCEFPFDDVRVMRQAGRNPPCPQCGGPTRQDFAAKPVAVTAFQPYDSKSLGLPKSAMRGTYTDERGDTWRRLPDGTVRQVNVPGLPLNPDGTVRINTPAARRTALQKVGAALGTELHHMPPPSDREIKEANEEARERKR